MFKRFSILFTLIIVIGCIVVLTGVQLMTEQHFSNYVFSYEEKIEKRISTYMNNMKEELKQAIESNAYWTDAVVHLDKMDNEWLSENATSYIIEMDLFNTDYILVTDEDLTYTQESDGEYKDVLLVDENVLDSLLNNNVNQFYKSVGDELLLVVSSPFLNNDLQNPNGLYICVKRLDSQFLNELQLEFDEELKNVIISNDGEKN